jgi:hypothetical protein
MKILLASLIVLVSLFQPHTSTQKKGKSKGKSPDTSLVSLRVPVVFGRSDDGLPERLKVRGVITGVSFAEAYCGQNFESGTIKVKLLDKIEGYPHENVFIVIPCFLDPNNEKKYLNSAVNLEAAKLYRDYNRSSEENPCYFEHITNTLQSRGIPFYCVRKGIREIIEGQGAPKKSHD